jgi:structural maintenance of chromosomes protein 5
MKAAELNVAEASSDLESLTERNRDVNNQLTAKRLAYEEARKETERLKKAALQIIAEINGNELQEDIATFHASLDNQEMTPDELESEIESESSRLELIHQGNPNTIKDFEKRQERLEDLKKKTRDLGKQLGEFQHAIKEIRDLWEPQLETLIGHISDAFAHNMNQIGCAGEVRVHKDDDFDQWAIQVMVKFR